MAWVNIWIARPGHGKSLATARVIRKKFKEYALIEKKFPEIPQRQLWCNLKLGSGIEKIELNRHLFYWERLDQMRYCRRENCWRGNQAHGIHDVDIVIDELPDYCPADKWQDLPRWARKMFSQHRHRGIRYYTNAQDYKMVDINFRRMIGSAFEVQKVMGSRDISPTLPPVKFVWGLIKVFRFDPRALEMDSINSVQLKHLGWPRYFMITRKLVDTYDTTQDLPEWRPDSLEHLTFKCTEVGCRYRLTPHVEHRKA